MRVAVLVVLLGCGRLGFEARDDAGLRDDAVRVCGSEVSGLLAHWSLDMDEVTATQVLDRTDHGRHGTLVGDPLTTTVGVLGDALQYPPRPGLGYFEASVPVSSAPADSTSVAMWFFHEGPTVDDVLVYLPPGPGAAPPRYDLWLNDRAGTPSLCINTGESECWGVSDATLLGRWVHVVAVFANGAASNGQLYIDGAARSMSCRFGTCDQSRVVAAPVQIGGSDSTYSWHGRLDDVRIYDRKLTESEASTLRACAP